MFVVENWSEEWAPPRDKDAAEPTISMHSEDGPPSVSEARLNQLGAAIWAVYDMRQIWQSLGERGEPVRRADAPGRNATCCSRAPRQKRIRRWPA
jgi:uncharacterized protein